MPLNERDSWRLVWHSILSVDLGLGREPIDHFIGLMLTASEVAAIRRRPNAVFARLLLHHRLVFRLRKIFHRYALL